MTAKDQLKILARTNISKCISWRFLGTYLSLTALTNYFIKAKLPQEGILFRNQFPSLGLFINKKIGFRKN